MFLRRLTRHGHALAVTALIASLWLSMPLVALAESKPRVGLVLGGGGARGVAHVGVLKVLEEMRIPISCISGTSMGSLVGGVYAAGLGVDEMSEWLAGLDWNSLFTDDPARNEKPFHAKRDDYLNLFDLELGQRGLGVVLPSGTTAGYKFEFLLREMVERSGNFADQDFDALPIPYRAIATNIENGTSKEFFRGDLVKAMRASMSVPGAISPVEIDGVLYVDGGLLQNVPIASARAACADVVIAVNVGSGLQARDSLNSALDITRQMIDVLMAQNVRQSLASLTDDDVLIEPELGSFSSANFSGSMPLIKIGEAAAREKAEQLRRYSVSEEAYQQWRAGVAARLPVVPAVTGVKVVTRGQHVRPEVLENEIADVPGIDLRRQPETDFSLTNLNDRLEQIYGRGEFERMDYRMVDQPGSRTVEVEGVEKSWGPNYLKFGLGMASDDEQNRFTVSASHRMTWVNALGGEWRNDLQVGHRDGLTSEFIQPLSFRTGAFVAPRIDLAQEPIVYYLDGDRVGDYQVEHVRLHLDVGAQNKFGEARAGLFTGTLEAKEDFGLIPGVPDFDIDQVGYTAQFVFDQMNDPNIMRDGFLVQLSIFGTVERWGSDDDYNKTDLYVVGAQEFGDHGVQLAGYWGDSLGGDIPVYDPFLLGGLMRGSGYLMDELLGNEVAMLRGVYTYRATSLPAPLGSGVYFGASLEATRAALGVDPQADKKVRPSASLFVSADTFLGPAYLAFGKALGGDADTTFYLLFGKP